MTIVLTGGHLTPALAVIDELKKRHPEADIHFIGRPTALEGSDVQSSERREIEGAGISFHALTTGRLTRSVTIAGLRSLTRIPGGFVHAYSLVRHINPDVILSFGGYIGMPVVVAGKLHGSKIAIHEQTMVPGLANRLSAFLADRICVSYQQTARYFRGSILTVGLPVRSSLLTDSVAPSSYARTPGKPFIYIAGGSTGSVSINTVVFDCLKDLVKLRKIIHQTGDLTVERAHAVRNTLPPELRKRYCPVGYIQKSSDLRWVYRHTDLYIGRSGANTVGELRLLGVPSLFIPLPWSGFGEQVANANLMAENGSATILEQQNLNTDSLVQAVQKMLDMRQSFYDHAQREASGVRSDGASALVDVLDSLTA